MCYLIHKEKVCRNDRDYEDNMMHLNVCAKQSVSDIMIEYEVSNICIVLLFTIELGG